MPKGKLKVHFLQYFLQWRTTLCFSIPQFCWFLFCKKNYNIIWAPFHWHSPCQIRRLGLCRATACQSLALKHLIPAFISSLDQYLVLRQGCWILPRTNKQIVQIILANSITIYTPLCCFKLVWHFFCVKRYSEKCFCLYKERDCFGPHWLSMYGPKPFKISHFVFSRRKQALQVWNKH